MDRLQSKLNALPDSPGVYQYLDRNGRLLYVGKAKSLKKRVKSYWRHNPLRPNPGLSARILRMLHETHDLEYIVVSSEEDALILENSLIKQLKPKYNILLRDDKTYPYIYIDRSQSYPHFEITRKIVKGSRITYYGPFPSGARALLNALYECYPLVQSQSCLRGKKACLFHQIGKCLAPCEGKISPEDYAKIVDEATEAIRKRSILIDKLQEKMLRYAAQERFEEAAKLRDDIEAIKALNLHSSLDLANRLNVDVFAVSANESEGVIVKLFMREGKVVSSSFNRFRHQGNFDLEATYTQALLSFYDVDTPFIPKEILLAHNFDAIESIEKTLRKRFDKALHIRCPIRGAKKRLAQTALTNAEELLSQKTRNDEIEREIARLCNLSHIPYRVEIFDTSHHRGEAAVGAIVVFEEGKWDKETYRRYTLEGKDEIAQMRELLERRIARFNENPPPDLWVIDGGKVNVKLARFLLDEAGVNLDVVAIAKEKLDAKAHRAKGAAKDILHTPSDTFELLPSDKRLQWIQRLRDEAHRYAITYHRNKKRKENLRFDLLSIKGIGPATIKRLLDYFGTFERIENASIDEIAAITNKKVANLIYEHKKN